jgi:CxxC motif-containing protein (DUF1111 family)
MANIDHFTQFIPGTQAPPRDTVLAGTADAQAGQGMFDSIGCNVCHVESITTAPLGTVIDGGMYTVPDALGNTIIHPSSDFQLHDVGTGDGIYQAGPSDTGTSCGPGRSGGWEPDPVTCISSRRRWKTPSGGTQGR